MSADFTLDEARKLLEALRVIAPDALRAPLSRGDLQHVMEAGVEVKGIDHGLLDFSTGRGRRGNVLATRRVPTRTPSRCSWASTRGTP